MIDYTLVTGTNLCDSTGALVASAVIWFAPVLYSGAATSFRPGAGGVTTSAPVAAFVADGAFSIELADTSLTAPMNLGYAVTVIDVATGDSLLGAGYGYFQPTGSTYDFDTFIPNLAGQVTVQLGPAGPQGPPGVGFTGAVNGLGFLDLATGQTWTMSVINGNMELRLGILPVLSYALADTVTGATWLLSVANLQWMITAGTAANTSPALVLADTVTGLDWSLYVRNGEFDITQGAAANSVAGFSFQDSATGLPCTLFVTNGALEISQI